jgi:hypothetical protein
VHTPRRAAVTSVVVLIAGISVPASAQRAQSLRGEQKVQMDALVQVVDEVVAQKHSAPADVALSWQSHFMKSDRGLVYMPYTVGIDGKFSTPPVAVYIRVLKKDAQVGYYDASRTSTMRTWMNVGGSPTQLDLKDIRSGNVPGTEATTQDAYFIEPPPDGRLSRALWLPPGEYDVLVGMRERPGKGLPKTVVLKQPITVPDLSKGLALSSLVLADGVEPATRATTRQQQMEQPYSMGGTKIIPSVGTRFKNTSDFTVVFYVYNPAPGPGSKPDVQVDYTFLQKSGDVERVFLSSPGQAFNAQTLPPEFSLAAGHQLMVGQSVPLGSFPPGQYRVQVTVTDNLAHTSVNGDVTFSVGLASGAQ